MERYSRQLRLEPIGIDGQSRLLASRVAVVGAGALGSAPPPPGRPQLRRPYRGAPPLPQCGQRPRHPERLRPGGQRLRQLSHPLPAQRCLRPPGQASGRRQHPDVRGPGHGLCAGPGLLPLPLPGAAAARQRAQLRRGRRPRRPGGPDGQPAGPGGDQAAPGHRAIAGRAPAHLRRPLRRMASTTWPAASPPGRTAACPCSARRTRRPAAPGCRAASRPRRCPAGGRPARRRGGPPPPHG